MWESGGSKRMKKIFLLIITCFLFASCVLAEKFTCEIVVQDASHYSVNFKGTLVSSEALLEIGDIGKLSKETDREIKAAYDELIPKLKEELPQYEGANVTIKSYKYQNNGRAYIEYIIVKKDGESLELMDIGLPLCISNYLDDNSLLIEIEGSGYITEALSEYGYKMDGKIIINSRLPILTRGAFGDNLIPEINGRYIFEKSFTSLQGEKIRFILGL
jgi:hypothetical protein